MNTLKYVLVTLLVTIMAMGCMKEEEMIESCSCVTTERHENGEIISQISSAEETPISGNCLDLNLFVIDQETGISTSKLCRK